MCSAIITFLYIRNLVTDFFKYVFFSEKLPFLVIYGNYLKENFTDLLMLELKKIFIYNHTYLKFDKIRNSLLLVKEKIRQIILAI